MARQNTTPWPVSYGIWVVAAFAAIWYRYNGSSTSAAGGGIIIDGAVFPPDLERGGGALVGGGTRTKYGVAKVYAVALYIDSAGAAGSLKRFAVDSKPPKNSKFYQAIIDGTFMKTLYLQMLRSVASDTSKPAAHLNDFREITQIMPLLWRPHPHRPQYIASENAHVPSSLCCENLIVRSGHRPRRVARQAALSGRRSQVPCRPAEGSAFRLDRAWCQALLPVQRRRALHLGRVRRRLPPAARHPPPYSRLVNPQSHRLLRWQLRHQVGRLVEGEGRVRGTLRRLLRQEPCLACCQGRGRDGLREPRLLSRVILATPHSLPSARSAARRNRLFTCTRRVCSTSRVCCSLSACTPEIFLPARSLPNENGLVPAMQPWVVRS